MLHSEWPSIKMDCGKTLRRRSERQQKGSGCLWVRKFSESAFLQTLRRLLTFRPEDRLRPTAFTLWRGSVNWLPRGYPGKTLLVAEISGASSQTRTGDKERDRTLSRPISHRAAWSLLLAPRFLLPRR